MLATRRSPVWTTGAPYRETITQIEHWAAGGALGVETHSAPLSAFAEALSVCTGLVVHFTNAIDQDSGPFAEEPQPLRQGLDVFGYRASSRVNASREVSLAQQQLIRRCQPNRLGREEGLVASLVPCQSSAASLAGINKRHEEISVRHGRRCCG